MIDIDTYIDFVKKVNPENYELACIYATNKEELIAKMKNFFKDEYDYDEEEIKDLNIEEYWDGEGFYDYVGRNFRVDSVMKIENIIEAELDNMGLDVEILTDTKNWIQNYKQKEGYNYIYPVFGVNNNNQEYFLEYIVCSNVEVNPFDVLENNGIEPYAWGIFSANINQWANFYTEELNDMDLNDLLEFFIQYNSDTREFEIFNNE
jgi:hypothetical protein